MQNFKPYRNDTFRWDSAPEGEIVRVEVDYRKGGMNYWNYKQEPRGYWLSISSLKVERKETYRTETRMIGGGHGRKFFLRASTRLVASHLAALAAKFDGDVAQIAAWFTENPEEYCAQVKTLIDSRMPAPAPTEVRV